MPFSRDLNRCHTRVTLPAAATVWACAARRLPRYAALRARTGAHNVFGVYDDHDLGQNDGGRDVAPAQQAAAQRLLLDFLDVPPQHARRARRGVYASHTLDHGCAARARARGSVNRVRTGRSGDGPTPRARSAVYSGGVVVAVGQTEAGRASLESALAASAGGGRRAGARLSRRGRDTQAAILNTAILALGRGRSPRAHHTNRRASLE